MANTLREGLNSWARERRYPFVVFGDFSVLGYAFTKQMGQTIETHRDYWSKIDERKMGIYALEMATRGFFPVHRGQIGLTLPMTDDDIAGYMETTTDIISDIHVAITARVSWLRRGEGGSSLFEFLIAHQKLNLTFLYVDGYEVATADKTQHPADIGLWRYVEDA